MRRFYLFKSSRHCRFPLFALLVLIALSADGQRVAEPRPQGGKVRLKVSEAFATQLESRSQSRMRSADGLLNVGHQALDAVSRQYKATAMRRVFRPAGKFEAKHRRYGLHLWYEIDMDSSLSETEAAKSFGLVEHVTRAEFVPIKYMKSVVVADRIPFSGTLTNGANDALFEKQWNFKNTGQTGGTPGADINILDAWKIETGDPKVIVSVVDGGVQYDHPDLAANMWRNPGEIAGNKIDDDNNGFVDDIYGYGFSDNTGTPVPIDHGTHVAGVIAAVTNNGIGVAGIAGGSGNGGGARIMTTSVAGNLGGGGFEEAYIYAADNGAVISQNSWAYAYPDVYEQSLLDALDYFIAEAGRDENGVQTGPMNGGIVMFSTGNSNYYEHYYPAYYEPVLSVAASSDLDKKASYSNYGTWADITAPGGDLVGASSPERYILSTVVGGWTYMDGTSMACPHVSGVAALVLSKYGGPGFTPAMLRKRLLETTDDIDQLNPDYAGQLGSGRLNAYKALKGGDLTPPSKITNLAIQETGVASVRLTWTAPADGATSPYRYELRYAATAITDATTFSAATLAAAPKVPSAAGTTETWTVTGLNPGQTYYFAIRSSDFEKNISPVSNTVSTTTPQNPLLTVSPTAFSVALKTAGIVTKQLTLANGGPGSLTYSLSHPAYLSLSQTQGTVAAGAQVILDVTIDAHALAAGVYNTPLTITTNQWNVPTREVPVTLTVTDLGTPLIETSSAAIDFATIFEGGSASKTLTITNAGTKTLSITGISIDDPSFAVMIDPVDPSAPLPDPSAPLALAPLQSQVITITCLTPAPGQVQGLLTIESNDPDQPALQIPLEAEGIAAPGIDVSPASVTASLVTGGTATRNIVITNTGGSPLEFSIHTQFDTKRSEITKVLILSPDYDVTKFEAILDALTNIRADVLQHYDVPNLTVADLTPYDIVVISNLAEWLFEGNVSPIKIGNVLADYVDQGGRVIANNQVYDNQGWGLKGRFIDQQYGPFLKSGDFFRNQPQIQLQIPSSPHPMFEGVNEIGYFSAPFYDLQTTPGASVIAHWANGAVFAAIKGSVLGINMVPAVNFDAWTGDVPKMYENAIHWLMGHTPIKTSVTQGTIPVGGYTNVTLTMNASGLATGSYPGAVKIYTRVPQNETVTVDVTLDVAGPDVTASETEIIVEAAAGQSETRTFTFTNNGTSPVSYDLSIENQDVEIFETNRYQSDNARGASPASSGPRPTTLNYYRALAAGSDETSASSARVAGLPVYATGFENFAPGSVEGQNLWVGAPGYGLWTVQTANPDKGSKHLRVNSDGRGLTVLASPLASVSHTVDKTTMSMRLNFDHSRNVSWEIVPQAEGFAVTHLVLFNTGKFKTTVYAGIATNDDGEPDFRSIASDIPEGYFTLAIEVERVTGIFSVYFDNRRVFTGQGNIDWINQFALVSHMQVADRYMDIDDVRIMEGDRHALSNYLTLLPPSGTLAAGASTQIQATFDAAVLPYGTFKSDIVVTTDKIERTVIPSTFTVLGDPAIAMSPILKNFEINYQEDSVQRITLFNTGGAPVDYSLSAPGYESVLSFDPPSGTIPVGGQQEVAAKVSTASYEIGAYTIPFIMQSSVGDVQKEMPFAVLDPPIINVLGNNITVAVPAQNQLLGTLSVRNAGTSALKFSAKLGATPWDGAINSDPGFDVNNFGALDGTNAIISPNQIAASAPTYRFDVDQPVNGPVSGQLGWYASSETWIEDFAVLNTVSDGSGIPSMAFTPVVADDGSKLTAASFYYYSQRAEGDIYQIIFQSVREHKIATRVQIDDTGVHILTAGAGGNATFQKLDLGDLPYSREVFDATFDIRVDRATSQFTLWLYGIKIFEGKGFASAIDQVVFYNSNTTPDMACNLQELVIGKIASWVAVPGNTLELTSSSQANLTIRVNTYNLPAGVYEDVIRVASNDPNHPVITIPVHLEVITPVFEINTAPIQGISETGKLAGQNVTITNTGASDLDYVFLGYGYGADRMVLPRHDIGPAATGGPDGAGYFWTSSQDPSGTPYVWNDIAATGTRLVMHDYMIKPVDLPFEFPFYDNKLSRVTITSMGALIFGYENVYDMPDVSFHAIPNPSGANNFLSPAGQSMVPDSRSRVTYKGDAEKWIVQYDNVSTGITPDLNSYQVILYKDGKIDFVYKELYYPYGDIGIENATGTEGLELDFLVDFDRPVFETTIRFEPSVVSWILPQMPEGVVRAGQSLTVPISFDATGLEPGTYKTTLFIGTNDPDHRAAGIPVTFTVTDKIFAGTEKEVDNAVRVYPVPSEDVVNIDIRKPTPQGATITLGNAQGQVMYSTAIPAGTTSHQLKLRDLHASEGIYYVKVDAVGWSEVRKVARK